MKVLRIMMWASLFLLGSTKGQEIVLKTGIDETTTGNLLDGVGPVEVTTNVVEIDGLMIRAHSGSTNQQINANSSSLGINSDGSSDTADAFDAGEILVLSFSNRVRIRRIDFNRLSDGEGFLIDVPGRAGTEIVYDGLSNKTSGYFDADIVVLANTDIRFSSLGESVVGMDGIDLEVLPTLSMVYSNDVATVDINLDGVTPTNHVLQHIGSLTDSNGWQTVATSFSTSTNWAIATTNVASFYRILPE